VHHGHLIAALSLAEVLRLDQVRLVIAREQPLKGGLHVAAAQHRARMVELAVQGTPVLKADRRELQRLGPSYTVDTLRDLQTEEPGSQLMLLVGSDTASEMNRWHEPEAIRELARVVVFRRGEPVSANRPGPAEFAVPRVDISSTEIRRRIAAKRSIRYWVPDAVADYIATHRLYQD
jgi:nicotinate-nucleotide adenylyltransferase